jgi:hypothetical protein
MSDIASAAERIRAFVARCTETGPVSYSDVISAFYGPAGDAELRVSDIVTLLDQENTEAPQSDPIELVDHRSGEVEAVLSSDSDAGDKGDLLATARRHRQGWIVRTPFGHGTSEWIRLKKDAVTQLVEVARDEYSTRSGGAR